MWVESGTIRVAMNGLILKPTFKTRLAKIKEDRRAFIKKGPGRRMKMSKV